MWNCASLSLRKLVFHLKMIELMIENSFPSSNSFLFLMQSLKASPCSVLCFWLWICTFCYILTTAYSMTVKIWQFVIRMQGCNLQHVGMRCEEEEGADAPTVIWLEGLFCAKNTAKTWIWMPYRIIQ